MLWPAIFGHHQKSKVIDTIFKPLKVLTEKLAVDSAQIFFRLGTMELEVMQLLIKADDQMCVLELKPESDHLEANSVALVSELALNKGSGHGF